MNPNNSEGSKIMHASLAVLVVALFSLPMLYAPAVVQASSYDKSTGKSADPAYLAIGNGVLVGTFTRDVPGIQNASNVLVQTSSGIAAGGWV